MLQLVWQFYLSQGKHDSSSDQNCKPCLITPIWQMQFSHFSLDQQATSALIGLFTGACGSLIAPWVNWGVEARRERVKARKQLLVDARTLLKNPPPVSEFRSLPLYCQLMPYLSESTNRLIQGKFDKNGNEIITIVVGPPPQGPARYATLVLRDISAQEIEWKLL